MVPGDLVTLTGKWRCDLYNDSFSERYFTIPNEDPHPTTGISFTPGEIGTVLVVKSLNPHDPEDKTIKILTQNGMGWVFSRWVRVIS